jgi:hypothetical protein
VRIEIEQGQVLKFAVQLEYDQDGWQPVIRYDTAHGYAHCDIIHPYGDNEKRRMSIQNYNDALQIAIDDLLQNRHWYQRRYEAWLHQQ